MLNTAANPELKEIIGALILSTRHPLAVRQIRESLLKAATDNGGAALAFKDVREPDIINALGALAVELKSMRCGLELVEVAGGYRFQTAPSCGAWVRTHLEAGKSGKLSKPCLETLAIIAYRQPITRAEIEGIRGVNVDHVVKTLLEAQLIRIVGRSELPGRPFQYGTTRAFLEYFGLKDIKDLASIDPMLFRSKTIAAAVHPPPQASATETSSTEKPDQQESAETETKVVDDDDDDVEEFPEDEYDDEDDDEDEDEDDDAEEVEEEEEEEKEEKEES